MNMCLWQRLVMDFPYLISSASNTELPDGWFGRLYQLFRDVGYNTDVQFISIRRRGHELLCRINTPDQRVQLLINAATEDLRKICFHCGNWRRGKYCEHGCNANEQLKIGN